MSESRSERSKMMIINLDAGVALALDDISLGGACERKHHNFSPEPYQHSSMS